MTRNQVLHEAFIPALAVELGVSRYLELGSHENETLAGVAEVIGPENCYAVDLKEPAWKVVGANYRFCTTTEYLDSQAASDGPFDLVFIDADHKAESVLADFDGVWPHVADEGLVLLHDGNPETVADTAPGYCNDSWLAIRQISMFHEAVTLPYHPGLTIVRKRVSWGPVGINNPRASDSPGQSAGKELVLATVQR